jgi:hypothetical protein
MGRLQLAFACALACLVVSIMLALPARGGGDQPMTWSKHQWRSDLFDTYPLRPRHHRVRVVKHVVQVLVAPQMPHPAAVKTKPVRPLLIRGGRTLPQTPMRGTTDARDMGRCSGVLVLTWDGRRARRECR